MNYEIISKSNIELSSTDIRNINIHTLIKRSIKAIESYKNIDPKDFKSKTKGLYEDNVPYKKFVNEIFLQNEGRKLLKTLNKGDSVLYLPDQDYGYKKSIFLDFFNHKALTVIFPSLLVKRTRCKVFLLTLVKENDFYVADLEPLMLTGESVEEDLKIVNSAIENFAQKHKSEYFWIHRRFKNRPEGEENFYPDDALRKEWL